MYPDIDEINLGEEARETLKICEKDPDFTKNWSGTVYSKNGPKDIDALTYEKEWPVIQSAISEIRGIYELFCESCGPKEPLLH